MIITTLIEDTLAAVSADQLPAGLTAEHGLSLLVESTQARVLFDTGTSGAFVDNARLLGVDLTQLDAAVISHHHYDHGGGLERLFDTNPAVRIWMKPPPDGEPVAATPDGSTRPIGINQDLLSERKQRFVLATGPVQIAPGVTLLPDISSAYPLPAGNERLLLASSNGTRPDPFDHELAIVVEEACEIVVITGCAHRGILNIVATCADAFPRHPIRAVVGGFHLNSEADAAVVAVANGLRERAVRQVVTGHCTGRNALAILTAELGDERVTPLATGCRFAFPV